MRRDSAQSYQDQYEYLADCFELIRKKGDAYGIRLEAQETERMVRYSERTGFESERSHLLEVYRDIEAEVDRLRESIREKHERTPHAPSTFLIDQFVERFGLCQQELEILLVLLYNESVGRNHSRFNTGNEILNLLFPNPVSALKASKYLDAGSTLISKQLISVIPDDDSSHFMRATYEVSETTLKQVLGRPETRSISTQQIRRKVDASPLRTVAPRVSLDSVVLPEDIRTRVSELIWQVRKGQKLFEDFGLDLEKGRGTIALFSGDPGTGKTLTAEAIAHELGTEMSVIDFSQLESKWIGETEKNIVAVFRRASTDKSLLLIDEADAILAGRISGEHYNDRAYNRQVSLLLTELEAFEGICILTTNREVSLDAALARRLSARIDFPLPDTNQRHLLWKRHLTPRIPLSREVDIATLASEFVLAGGSIKNAVLSAVRK
ncbi:MAG: ATP-binding protein, partial [Candidatus Eisenbacteria bacterium]|nr:ATP-binding protein [Candidatus Eisenbacteria bacterium]